MAHCLVSWWVILLQFSTLVVNGYGSLSILGIAQVKKNVSNVNSENLAAVDDDCPALFEITPLQWMDVK